MKNETYTLENGLRVIVVPGHTQVVCCGYAIGAGSRHETPEEMGMAHFCEHLTFKGSRHRSAMQILNSLESVGGDLNAFTNKEHTVYYATVLFQHLPRAIDLLTDIVFDSTYPQQEIDKEVEVVCDEIESYNDSPAELIYDEYENILFKGHPLGHHILGCPEQLRQYTTNDVTHFARKHYRPENAVFFVQLPADSMLFSKGKVVKLLERAFQKAREEAYKETHEETHKEAHKGIQNLAPEGVPNAAAHNTNEAPSGAVGGASSWVEGLGKCYWVDRSTHQAHVIVGCPAFSMHDNRRIALFLLNNILGGPAMNSRLNLSLRERRGLVYTVESSMATYSDTGVWTTYFGCDNDDVKKCLRLVRRELNRLMERPLSEAQLNAAKRQLKGQMGIATDNRENYTIDVAKNFLHKGWEQDIDLLLKRIDELTADEVQQVAQMLFQKERMTTLIYSRSPFTAPRSSKISSLN